MKTKTFFLVILVAFAANIVTFSQSLGSQLKVIAGDALTTYGKNNFSRFLGKALSTSGNMQYNMEMIQAQNKKELTINLPPNTSLNQNNQAVPNAGYQWANPSNPVDYNVVPVSEYNYATLPPYNLNYLQNKYAGFEDNSENLVNLLNVGSTLNLLFTYNWASDLNEDGKFSFNEFNNIKRVFKFGEPMSFAYSFIVRCGTNSLGEDVGDRVCLLLQIFMI